MYIIILIPMAVLSLAQVYVTSKASIDCLRAAEVVLVSRPVFSFALFSGIIARMQLGTCKIAWKCLIVCVACSAVHAILISGSLNFNFAGLEKESIPSSVRFLGGVLAGFLAYDHIEHTFLRPRYDLLAQNVSSLDTIAVGLNAFPATPPPSPPADSPLKELFDAVVAVFGHSDWETARTQLQPVLAAAPLAQDAMSCVETRVKELHILELVHGQMEPDRAFAKLSDRAFALHDKTKT